MTLLEIYVILEHMEQRQRVLLYVVLNSYSQPNTIVFMIYLFPFLPNWSFHDRPTNSAGQSIMGLR